MTPDGFLSRTSSSLQTERTGTFVYQNGDVYTGEWQNGKRHGRGKICYFSSARGGDTSSQDEINSPIPPSRPESLGADSPTSPHVEHYEGEWNQDMMHGFGRYVFRSGSEYAGEWRRGQMEGKGEYRYRDGNLYRGYCLNNMKEGFGTLLYKDGSLYEGSWSQDKPHGHGVFRTVAGGVYDGEWCEGRVHGRGTYVYSSGKIYDGLWCRDRREGRGVLRHVDGSVFEGMWKKDAPHGVGCFKLADGTGYEGVWTRGRLCGAAKVSYANHATFAGEWRNNQKEGFGIFTCADGTLYEGNWKAGKPHGEGRMRWTDGRVEDDLWVAGMSSASPPYIFFDNKFHIGNSSDMIEQRCRRERPDAALERMCKSKRSTCLGSESRQSFESSLAPVEPAEDVPIVRLAEAESTPRLGVFIVQYPDGSIYEGSWKANKPNGFGRFRSKTGSVYHGEWRNGAMDGRGRYTYSDKSLYVGHCQQGKKNGFGLFVTPDGASYEGSWKDDKPHGNGVLKLPSGFIYEGGWRGRQRDGEGDCTYPDGSRYSGAWEKDMKTLKGSMAFADGLTYVGEWHKDKAHGTGVYTSRRGSIYDGQWVEGKREGQGRYAYSNGTIYEGDWKNDNKHGYGVIRFHDGAIYEGSWADNRAHGEGRFTLPEGSEFAGMWERGELYGQCRWQMSSHERFDEKRKGKYVSYDGASEELNSEGMTTADHMYEEIYYGNGDFVPSPNDLPDTAVHKQSNASSSSPCCGDYWIPREVGDRGVYFSRIWRVEDKLEKTREKTGSVRQEEESVETEDKGIQNVAPQREASIDRQNTLSVHPHITPASDSPPPGSHPRRVETRRTTITTTTTKTEERKLTSATPFPTSSVPSVPRYVAPQVSTFLSTSPAQSVGYRTSTTTTTAPTPVRRTSIRTTKVTTRPLVDEVTSLHPNVGKYYSRSSQFGSPRSVSVPSLPVTPQYPTVGRIAPGWTTHVSYKYDTRRLSSPAFSSSLDQKSSASPRPPVTFSHHTNLTSRVLGTSTPTTTGDHQYSATTKTVAQPPRSLSAAPTIKGRRGEEAGGTPLPSSKFESSRRLASTASRPDFYVTLLPPSQPSPAQPTIIPVPEYHYREIPVERVVEVPQTVEKVLIKEVPVPRYIETPVYETVDVPVDKEIVRQVPVPVEHIVNVEFTLPKVRPMWKAVDVPIFAPRFVEVPIPVDILDEDSFYLLEDLSNRVANILSNPSPSLCELQRLAETVQSFKLNTTEAQVEQALKECIESALARSSYDVQKKSTASIRRSSTSHVGGGITVSFPIPPPLPPPPSTSPLPT